MKAIKGLLVLLSSSLVLFLFMACSNLMGYGVVLWSIPEENLHDGDIVPVYIKSNINQVWVIGIPGTERKVEVPLWQITDPESKKDIEKTAERFLEYKGIYASVKRDGLPVRYEPTNTGRQVYRLKVGEILKVLYKGTGSPVTGLEGDWLRVVMEDGSIGWCFSYNLNLFDETDGFIQEEIVEDKDELLETILSTRWYPQSYETMIRDGYVNIDVMKPLYGFSCGLQTKMTELILPSFSLTYAYKGVNKIDNKVYEFIDTPLTMTIKDENFIVIQYKDNSGKPTSFNFIALQENIEDIIADEKARRELLLNSLRASGPSYSSSNYGALQFLEDDTFLWTGYSLLSPSIIPSGAGSRGTVELKYFLGKQVSFMYDGILSLTFESASAEICFFYKLEENGLRLEHVPLSLITQNVAERQSANPLVMFFAK